MKFTKLTAVSLFLVFGFAKSTLASDIYVSPSGSDTNQGTQSSPVASLAKAQSLARTFSGIESVTVHVADGVYYLPETIVFEPADSGSDEHPVVYAAEHEGGAVLSGGTKLSLAWQPYRNGIFAAMTPAGLVIDQLFVDGQSQRMARYPNYDASKPTEAYQGFAADAFSIERAAAWADPTGGYIHAMHRSRWGGYHYQITGKDSNGEVTYEGGWQNNRKSGMHNEFRMVENIFEELDAPAEWFHDVTTSTLYYMPVSGVDLANAVVEVVRLKHLVEFQGSLESPVRNITMKGFAVRHAARTFMETKEQMLRSDWAIYRGGAFVLTGTEDIHIVDCEFDQVGGNAIFVNNYNRGTVVKGTHIHDTGASGVCFVGDPDAVRDPLFEYGQKNDLEKIDRTPGPKTQNFPSLGTVEDCLIHGIGRVERQPAGVQMEMSQEITVRDCSIYDCARAGINIGDGAWGGHLIERCDVFDTVLETHDHGSFNSWGRDRYWRSDQGTSQKAVDADPDLPFLDAVKTTTIRNSRWRCDHGWDIDLDDGSSNYDIYNNLLLNSGLKLREGFRRHAWNNVIPYGSFHPHVWYDGSKDQVYANIFAFAHRPARMSSPYVNETMVDRNLFTTQDPSILKASEKLGWDKHSVLGDPMFVDPASGDFRVKEGSPALQLGFKNFPMDQFGVKKASLKAIAETPAIPDLTAGRSPNAPVKTVRLAKSNPVWLGATLHSIEGEEFSAFGTNKEDGGVALTKVSKTSAAAKAGLRENDLIQAVNGKPVATVEKLFGELSKTESASVKLKVIRDQQARELTVERPSVVEIESSSSANGFKKLPLPSSTSAIVTTNQKTSDDPISTLIDGKLNQGYGPIFGNGIRVGAYKMDLGSSSSVAAVTSWSFNKGGKRGAQILTVYGSNASSDPGWDLTKFTAIGNIYTGEATAEYTAASLRSPEGKPLGKFRWIVWAVSPVTETGGGENTAFQEFAVEAEASADVQSESQRGSNENSKPNSEEVSGLPQTARPNIVFLMTDDQRWDMFGCYGRNDVETPNIDKLAAQGVVFDNAYYAVAICMPSRATMFTGRYFSDHRSGFTYPYDRAIPKEEFADSYPAQLKQAGYRTGFVGKFGTRLEEMEKSVAESFDYFVVGDNVYFPKGDPGLEQIYRHDRPRQERTLKKGDAMIRFLETQPIEQPFCLSISFDAVKNDKDSDMYAPHVERFKDRQMWVPENWVAGKNDRLPDVLDHCRGTYLHVARTATPEQYQNVARRFAVQGYTVDLQVERLMAKLEEMGVLENTVVIYTSDNGRFHGSQGLFDKAILYEEAMKEPLIIFDGRAPQSQRGRRVDAMVSSVDIAPTILSLAGLKTPEIVKGRDLRGLLKGTQDLSQWRDAVLLENFFIQEIHAAGVKKRPDIPELNDELIAGNRSYRTQGIRTDRYKYFRYHEHDPVIEELYDLAKDPHELNNLVSNPEYADVLSKLRTKTEELLAEAIK
ncbi:sulfatase-like hydrolase/transferase [Neorhodopirellula pilleata]|uniref:Arylsulfatase n=1 Tax=Neorhodopirellula pilleata TaxID=2714738 RepID=A0A5C5ZVG3_9BACT|nr:sulfatase-like hydrolase/transferase [Neorhodopirellula pilleata]TWT91230.1 Arylsulfatase [Neorhodopirellula pilleata]